jgi:Tfp pilus assembly PilM family ATPase
VAFCDIGETSTNIAVANRGVCEFTRLTQGGVSQFIDTLAEQFGWTTDDARRVTFEAGVLPPGGVESPDDPYADSRRIQQYVADQFASELRQTLDYVSHSTNVGVSAVVISGQGALLAGLDQRLADSLGLPVTILDASPMLDPGSVELLGPMHAHLAVALGLGMEAAA